MQPFTLADKDTIAAISSAPGPACRSILRISGSEVARVLTRTLADDVGPVDRAVRFRSQVELQPRVDLPVLVNFWPDSRSFTGEPMSELHVPGSPPLVEAVLRRLFDAGARPARRGEFTLRAFLAGKLDLTQAEAVLGVIDAADSAELTTALRQLAGGLSSQIAAVRDDLMNLLADLEAGLDFVDEDIEFISRDDLTARLNTASAVIRTICRSAGNRMQSRPRARVVLAGLPNAGKSTLFNRLASTDAAIVSNQSGTTRDYLTAVTDWDHVKVELIDTAGWESGQEGLESLAQHFRDEQIRSSDLIIWCTSAALPTESAALDENLRRQMANARELIHVRTQTDRAADARTHTASLDRETRIGSADVSVSAITGEGIAELKACVTARLVQDLSETGELVGSTAARSGAVLDRTLDRIAAAEQLTRTSAGDELVAVELREAIALLGEIIGAVYTDDLLDRVFSRFCIGK